MTEREKILKKYREFRGKDPLEAAALPRSGSDRRYFRLEGDGDKIIGVYNPSVEENDAFTGFTGHFALKGLQVPVVYRYYRSDHIYFMQDLGDISLFSWLNNRREKNGFDSRFMKVYRSIIDSLVRFQVDGIEGLDLSLCYQQKSFDRQSMLWDMNYFKYMFLKLVAVPVNEKELEKDFVRLADLLLGAGQKYFLYRDFQSSNIMLVDGNPWFIDYQGGRTGAPQYDITSLLYDSKAELSAEVRKELLDYYIGIFSGITGEDKSVLRSFYPAFALIRIMQALGAYGYRGIFEHKPGFIQSIPPAVRDISSLMKENGMENQYPELFRVISTIPRLEEFELPN